MPLFRRPGKGGDMHDSNPQFGSRQRHHRNLPAQPRKPPPEVDQETQEKAQQVMKDHLEIMKDVVMKIRHQEGYAKAMYANCPRLQHLLDKNPDLRPVFEDPRLVRINFETVYKEAGGILPEDEEEEERKRNNPSLIMRIANHPIFKILKVLIFVKKFIGCIFGGGIALVGSIWACMTDCCTDCCCEDDIKEVGEVDEYYEDNEYGLEDMPMDENQRALNSAADYMEDPEVQEQMQRLLEDPEHLEDAIENDAELRGLRDSNPLCAELMQDPETMKILVDPDNLRALGEAPHMIELDFNDPHGFQPQSDFVDLEMGEVEMVEADSGLDVLEVSGEMDGMEAYEADYGDENEAYFPMEDDTPGMDQEYQVDETWDDEGLDAAEADADIEADMAEEMEMTEVAGTDEVPAEQQAATSNWEDDFELEQQETDVDAANKGKGRANNAKNKNNKASSQGGIKGAITAFGVAATDVIAAQIVGEVFGTDIMPGDLTMGGGDDMGLSEIDTMAANADMLVNDDITGLAEDTADGIGDERAARGGAAAGGVAAGGGVAGGAAFATSRGRSRGQVTDSDSEDSSLDDGLESIGEESEFDDDDDDDIKNIQEEETEKKSKKFFGAFKNLASATMTAAKEQVATTLLGDDFGEMLVEKMEEGSEDEDDEDDKDEGKKNEDKKKRFRLFGKKKEDELLEEEDEMISEDFVTSKDESSQYISSGYGDFLSSLQQKNKLPHEDSNRSDRFLS